MSDFGVVLLTMGQRPEELDRALRSLLSQRDVDVDIVVVGNSWQPVGLPDGVKAVGLADNQGIPAGRNAGVDQVQGDLLFFLDDDAFLPDPFFLASLKGRFESDPQLGLVQPRVEDPEGVPPPGRWVPRLFVGDRTRSGPATTLWGGSHGGSSRRIRGRGWLAGGVLLRTRRN